MFKVLYLARRRAEVDHDEVVRFWRERNVIDVAAGLDPDRYTVTFFEQRGRSAEHVWDGMAAVWFADAERGRQVTDPVPEPARRNGFAELLDTVLRFEADEHVLFDRLDGAALPEGALTLTFLVVARPGVRHGALVDHWVNVHGPAVAAPMADIPGALRYVASPARGDDPERGYAGVTELSYADVAASKAHAAALRSDGFEALADNGIFLVGRQFVVR